ncbi:MAG: succinate dehydrogenase, hydrophobic membrane anchor protein [Candidatus Comchoanobacterales bacterium]
MNNIDRRGVRDWWLQRVSALVVLAYALTLMTLIVFYKPQTFIHWSGLVFSLPMKILGVLGFLGMVVHAAIGFWVVATDYIKCSGLRKGITIAVHIVITLTALLGIYVLVVGSV